MSYVVKVGNRVLTEQEDAAMTAKKRRLHGGIEEILRSRQVPGAKTDTSFLSSFGTLLDQCDGDERYCQHLVNEARKQGYEPGANDVYMPTIAQRMGDPRAFIRSKGEMIRLAEERGKALEIDGEEVVHQREPDRDPWEREHKLNPELVKEVLPMVKAANPKADPRELVQIAEEKFGLDC